MSQTWDQLVRGIDDCYRCDELSACRSSTVPGDPPGRSWSGVVLVGEAPGADEDAVGRPFVGRSGMVLDSMLEDVGLRRDDVAVVNVLRCRPPGNRAPRVAEIENCRPWMQAQLDVVRPRLIVTLGTTALQWFLGRSARIGTARSAVREWRGIPVMATYHPSAALRFGPRGVPALGLREDLTRVAAWRDANA